MTFTTELRVPPEAVFASLVEAFATDAARRAELDDERRNGLATAARRGFETIVGSALVDDGRPIRVVARCTPLALSFSLFERGLPMDDSLATRDTRWSELAALVDGAHWHLHGTAGSELRLIVNHRGALRAGAARTPVADDVEPAPEQEYEVRRFRPADAAGVARAFYLTYGYAYDLAAVYDPARLVALNEKGSYLSIVAVAADGEVVGHYALAREGDEPVADAAGAVVVPAHRGRDLLNRLRDRAENEAIALGLAGYYSEPVTDHPRTQLSSESFGAKACGITLGEAPRGFVARHMELSTTTQRQSCMLYVKALRPREPRTIHPPPRHRAMIAAIYDQLGLPVAMGEPATPSARGTFHTGIVCGDAFGTIAVESVGAETCQLACQAAEDLRALRRLGAIYASLPLEDPGTPALCDALESRGFFFAGVGPWMLGGRDALRLQMTLTPIDLSALVVVGEFGRVLLEYIRSERERCAVHA